MAFLLSWIKAICSSAPIVSAIILSLSSSLFAAEPSPMSSGEVDRPINPVPEFTLPKFSVPTHTVVIGDTLWNVAARLRPDNMTMAQAMDSLYANNPEAFLDGDSSKLIEGSIVSFPPAIEVEKASETVVSEENADLMIPSIDLAIEDSIESIESAPSSAVVQDKVHKLVPDEDSQQLIDAAIESDKLPDHEMPNVDENTALIIPAIGQAADDRIELGQSNPALQDDVPNFSLDADLSPSTENKSQIPVPDSQGNQSAQQNTVEQQSSDLVIDQLKILVSEFDSNIFSQLLSRAKRLPADLWFFIGALFFAVIVNRLRKSRADNKAEDGSIKADEPIESLIDGPFADSHGDDVFAGADDKHSIESQKRVEIKAQSETDLKADLPGVEALEAQFREDADGQKPLASDFKAVDFEEDTLTIDPLQIKLDMASLCIEMGDIESAQAILEEIISEADKKGKAKALEILDSIET